MSDSVTRNINSSIQKTYEWLVDMEDELLTADRQIAYHALRSVLHALRDRLSADEAADLAAQLPTYLRGVFYEGWRPADKPEKFKLDEFLDRIATTYDATLPAEPLRFTEAVLAVLEKRISTGEMHDIRSTLPNDIRQLWPA
jgi:uncharacterized protein (DUF2267 family)